MESKIQRRMEVTLQCLNLLHCQSSVPYKMHSPLNGFLLRTKEVLVSIIDSEFEKE